MRYDDGRVTGAVRVNGRVLAQFDRVSGISDTGEPVAAADLTREPVVYGNTDIGGTNQSMKAFSDRVALTFDADGRISGLRISSGC